MRRRRAYDYHREARLKAVARHQRNTMLLMVGTIAALWVTGYTLYLFIEVL